MILQANWIARGGLSRHPTGLNIYIGSVAGHTPCAVTGPADHAAAEGKPELTRALRQTLSGAVTKEQQSAHGVCLLRYAAWPAMIDALCPPNPKLLLITARNFRSRGTFGV